MTAKQVRMKAAELAALVMQGHDGGKPFTRRYRFTDTWLKRSGQWQIIAAQDYLVPAGRK